jgi:hypothetical protein
MKYSNFFFKFSCLSFLALVIFTFLPRAVLALGSGPEGEPGLSGSGENIPGTAGPLSALQIIQGQVGDELMPAGDIISMIIRIINYILTFLGVIFILMIIYGGFMWMTAAGNEERVKKGKGILQTAIIGLTIIVLSRVLYLFILQRIQAV